MFVWSKINEVDDLSVEAINLMEFNECQYHNVNHIAEMYQYLHDTDEPYNKALDWAILYHDVIYDQFPDKEERSAKYFAECANGFMVSEFITEIEELIMATKFHLVEKSHWSPIVRADLHALADSEKAIENFELLKREALKLYNCSEKEWSINTIAFMQSLSERVKKNAEKYDTSYHDFYMKVYEGCVKTIEMAKKIK